MRDLGSFAQKAAPYATGLKLPDIAVILPQSRQLSVRNAEALTAQQAAIRALYYQNRVEAYAVGEYQIDTLGNPKLIILPSAYGLNDGALAAIEDRVRSGAVLLISGPFDLDEHMHPTNRSAAIGLDAVLGPLHSREKVLHSAAGDIPLEYTAMSTTTLDQAMLPNGSNWIEVPLGKGKILYSTLPLELNTDLASIAKVYAYAVKTADVSRTYTTPINNPGILVCPTKLADGTLYVLESETETAAVSFSDIRSGKTFSGNLEAGRAALLLVGKDGELVSSYGWNSAQ